jgi:predicted RNase H-like HicB family nuclease/predicted transcriptional regulator
MLAIRLPPEIEKRLEALARLTGRSKSYYVRAAILEHLGDLEDRHIAEAQLGGADTARPAAVRLAELKERYGALPPHAVPRTKGKAIMRLSAVLMPAQEGGFVALNAETGTTAQGKSIEEALANLREATELYLEGVPAEAIGHAVLTTFNVAARAG